MAAPGQSHAHREIAVVAEAPFQSRPNVADMGGGIVSSPIHSRLFRAAPDSIRRAAGHFRVVRRSQSALTVRISASFQAAGNSLRPR